MGRQQGEGQKAGMGESLIAIPTRLPILGAALPLASLWNPARCPWLKAMRKRTGARVKRKEGYIWATWFSVHM